MDEVYAGAYPSDAVLWYLGMIIWSVLWSVTLTAWCLWRGQGSNAVDRMFVPNRRMKIGDGPNEIPKTCMFQDQISRFCRSSTECQSIWKVVRKDSIVDCSWNLIALLSLYSRFGPSDLVTGCGSKFLEAHNINYEPTENLGWTLMMKLADPFNLL